MQVEPHEQSAVTEPASQDYPITLPGQVKLVSSHQGIGGFIRSRPFEKLYGVVNSIDTSGKLLHGVGCAIKELAGDDYARVTREKQCSENPSDRLGYGQCATCNLVAIGGRKESEDSGGKNWRVIHNVLVPLAKDPNFETHLKNSLLTVFKESIYTETAHIVLPLLGCGRAGGTGDRLAQALFAAVREFKSDHPHHQPPEVVLVGTESSEDRQALAAFESKWRALNQQAASSQPAAEPTPPSRTHQPDESTPSDISAGAVAKPVPSPSGVTPAASPSVGIPARAFSAGTDAMTRDDISRAHQAGAAPGEAAPNVRSPSMRPVSQTARKSVRASTVRLTLASEVHPVTLVFNADLKQFIEEMKEQHAKSQEDGKLVYGLVSPLDESEELQNGAARVVKDMVGARYALTIRKAQDDPRDPIEYGHAIWYHCPPNDVSCQSSGLNGLHSVYCARFPPSADHELFDDKLKEAILNVLSLAVNNVTRIIFPLLGCDEKTGGTGGQLAKVLHGALYDFRVHHPDEVLPQVFLLGADMDALARECQIAREFQDQWFACEQVCREQQEVREPALSDPSGAKPGAVTDVARTATEAAARASDETETNVSTETVTEVATNASAGAVARVGQDDDQISQHQVLINGLLEVAMCPDNGMFGYGRKLSSEGKAFDLVNAANEYMVHGSGVARQFENDLGAKFRDDTRAQVDRFLDKEVPVGQCITTGPYAYASDSRFGLTGCRYIHNVVAPNRNRTPPEEYDDKFKDAFVSVLLAAAERGSDTVVSCFVGCAIFGGNGKGMAHALHAAYQDDRIKSLPKVPRLVLTGWETRVTSDDKVYRDFVWTFSTLNDRNPIKLPSQG